MSIPKLCLERMSRFSWLCRECIPRLTACYIITECCAYNAYIYNGLPDCMLYYYRKLRVISFQRAVRIMDCLTACYIISEICAYNAYIYVIHRYAESVFSPELWSILHPPRCVHNCTSVMRDQPIMVILRLQFIDMPRMYKTQITTASLH